MSGKPKGFAAMDPEKRRAIAAMGGRAVKAEDRAYSKSRAKAVAAGRVGGSRVPKEKRSFHHNRALAARAGSKGGKTKRRPPVLEVAP